MPFLSKAQNRWAHTSSGESALGGAAKVKEWSDATNFSGLPERAAGKGDDPVADKWIKGAIKHPGALSKAASQNGVSKLQEAEKESHSSNPHIRARGALGKRFIQGKV